MLPDIKEKEGLFWRKLKLPQDVYTTKALQAHKLGTEYFLAVNPTFLYPVQSMAHCPKPPPFTPYWLTWACQCLYYPTELSRHSKQGCVVYSPFPPGCPHAMASTPRLNNDVHPTWECLSSLLPLTLQLPEAAVRCIQELACSFALPSILILFQVSPHLSDRT